MALTMDPTAIGVDFVRDENGSLSRREALAERLVLRSLPQRVVLEVTNRCNLRCVMCEHALFDFPKHHMAMEVFRAAEALFHTAREVTFFGLGEPTLHPRFSEMLHTAWAHPGLHTYFTSNGLLLDRWADDLVRGGLTFLAISIDGATPETYNRIRRHSDFHRVLENIRLINRLKERYRAERPLLRFTFTAMRSNVEELPLLVDLAHAHGVAEVKVIYMTALAESMVAESLWFHQDLAAALFDATAEKAERMGIRLILPPKIGQDRAGEAWHQACYAPWEDIFIASNGDIRACVISTEPLGNILRDDVFEAWNNLLYILFRSQVNSENPSPVCRDCHQSRRVNVNRKESLIVLRDLRT